MTEHAVVRERGVGVGVGERLKAARLERSLSLEDVASRTRVPQRHLRAIEDQEVWR